MMFVSSEMVAGRPSHPFENERDAPDAPDCFYKLVEQIEAARTTYSEVREHLSLAERKTGDWIDLTLQDALSDAQGALKTKLREIEDA